MWKDVSPPVWDPLIATLLADFSAMVSLIRALQKRFVILLFFISVIPKIDCNSDDWVQFWGILAGTHLLAYVRSKTCMGTPGPVVANNLSARILKYF